MSDHGMTMMITVQCNPWTLPEPPAYLEGEPSPVELARETAEAEAVKKGLITRKQADALNIRDAHMLLFAKGFSNSTADDTISISSSSKLIPFSSSIFREPNGIT